MYYLCNRKTKNGALAQLVEHRTENPWVPGSIPGGTTCKRHTSKFRGFFICIDGLSKLTLHEKIKVE